MRHFVMVSVVLVVIAVSLSGCGSTKGATQPPEKPTKEVRQETREPSAAELERARRSYPEVTEADIPKIISLENLQQEARIHYERFMLERIRTGEGQTSELERGLQVCEEALSILDPILQTCPDSFALHDIAAELNGYRSALLLEKMQTEKSE